MFITLWYDSNIRFGWIILLCIWNIFHITHDYLLRCFINVLLNNAGRIVWKAALISFSFEETRKYSANSSWLLMISTGNFFTRKHRSSHCCPKRIKFNNTIKIYFYFKFQKTISWFDLRSCRKFEAPNSLVFVRTFERLLRELFIAKIKYGS